MLPNDRWKEVIFDVVVDVCMRREVTINEAGKLRLSIKEPINEDRMNADTRARTEGRCPAIMDTGHGYVALTEAFATLNQGRDGG